MYKPIDDTQYTKESFNTEAEWLEGRKDKIGKTDITTFIQSLRIANGSAIDLKTKNHIVKKNKEFLDAVWEHSLTLEDSEGLKEETSEERQENPKTRPNETGFLSIYMEKPNLRADRIHKLKLGSRRKITGFNPMKDEVIHRVCEQNKVISKDLKTRLDSGNEHEPKIMEHFMKNVLKTDEEPVHNKYTIHRYDGLGTTPDFFIDGGKTLLEIKFRTTERESKDGFVLKYRTLQVASYILQLAIQMYTTNTKKGILYMAREVKKGVYETAHMYQLDTENELYKKALELALLAKNEINRLIEYMLKEKVNGANIGNSFYGNVKSAPYKDKSLCLAMYHTNGELASIIGRKKELREKLKEEIKQVENIHKHYIEIEGVKEKKFKQGWGYIVKPAKPTYYTVATVKSAKKKGEDAKVGDCISEGTEKIVYVRIEDQTVSTKTKVSENMTKIFN